MFKIIYGSFLYSFLWLGVSFSCAGESAEVAKVKYDWIPGQSYHFLRSIRNLEQESPRIDMIIECISRKDKNCFTLCIRRPFLSSDLVFPTVDEHGAVQDICIYQNELRPAKDSKVEEILKYLGQIVSVLDAYDERLWLLPNVLPESGAMSIAHGKVFVRNKTVQDKKKVVQLTVKPYHSVNEQVWTISFDTDRGIPVAIEDKGYDNLEMCIDYSEIKQLDESFVKNRRNALMNAVSVDEYIVSNAGEFISHDNHRIKKTAYLLIQRIKSCAERQRMWKRMNLSFSSDPGLNMLTELFLEQSVRGGCDWAIAELLPEKWNKLSEYTRMRRIGVMEACSGLRLGYDPAVWRDWFERIKLEAPMMENSSIKVLEECLDSKDIWVKVYALTELSKRNDISLDEWRSILEKAKCDNDVLVQNVSKDLWNKSFE